MSVKQRLKDLISSEKISDREFCRIIGVSESFVNSIRESIQPDKLRLIAAQFPSWNITWIMTGMGEKYNNLNIVAEPQENYSTQKESNLTFDDIAKAIKNLSEASVINAKASEINAKANEKNAEANLLNSQNTARMLELIEKGGALKNKKDNDNKTASRVVTGQ